MVSLVYRNMDCETRGRGEKSGNSKQYESTSYTETDTTFLKEEHLYDNIQYTTQNVLDKPYIIWSYYHLSSITLCGLTTGSKISNQAIILITEAYQTGET